MPFITFSAYVGKDAFNITKEMKPFLEHVSNKLGRQIIDAYNNMLTYGTTNPQKSTKKVGRFNDAERNDMYLAVKHGPIVLAARTGNQDLAGLVADDGRWSHIAHGSLVPVAETPIMIGTQAQIEQKVAALKPIAGKPLHFKASGLFDESRFADVELEPFFSLHDSRYAIYFLSLSQSDYKQMLEKIKADEAAALELDRRTVDAIVPGEQQPEADHKMTSQNSTTGNQDNKPYRTLRRGGSFSFDLYPDGNTNLSLSLG